MFAEILVALSLAVSVPAPASKQEKLAREIEAKMQAGTDGLTPNFDGKAFMATVTRDGEGIDPTFKQGFITGYRQKEDSLGTTIAGLVKQSARFSLLRMREVEGQTRLIYRLLIPGGGVSYFEMKVSPAMKVSDVYIFTSGEWLSETIRRLYLQSAAEASQGLLDKLKGKEQVFLKNLPTLTGMQKALAAKDNAKVLELYKSLPEQLKKEKLFLTMRVQAALPVDEKEYIQAIDDFRAAFANDPASDLMAIDGFFLSKKYDLAIAAIERLNKTIGGDAYLGFLRGRAYAVWGKAEESKAALAEAVKMEPSLVDPYWLLVEHALAEKKHDETARWLTAIERDTGTIIDDLNKVPVYGDFVKSKAYKKWLARAKVAN